MTFTYHDDEPVKKSSFTYHDDEPVKKSSFTYHDEPVKKSSFTYHDDEPKNEEALDNEQGLFFNRLDDLNRPQYGVANVIYKAVKDKNYDLAQNYWDGLSLNEKKSIGDTLTEVIDPQSTWGKVATGVAGFAGDVLTDPLTYVGVGLVNRAGKAIKAGSTASKFIKAGRSIGKAKDTKATLTFAGKSVPGSEKVIDPLARGAAKTGRFIREDLGPVSRGIDKLRAVSTKLRPKGTDPVEWQKYLRASDKGKNVGKGIQASASAKVKELYNSLKGEGLDDSQIAKLTDELETGVKATTAPGKIATELRDMLQDKYKNVGKTGKAVIDEKDISYVPHVLEKESARKKLGLSAKKWTTSSPSDIKRTIRKYTDEEGDTFILTKSGNLYKDGKVVKKFTPKALKEIDKGPGTGSFSQATIAEVNKGLGEIVFSTNLPKLLNIQSARAARVVSGDTFFKEVDKLASSKPKEGYIPVDAPELAGKYFDPEIANHIDETYHALKNPEETTAKALKIFDAVTNTWKTSATILATAFHTRNFASNIFQNMLGGVSNPKYYTKAMGIQTKLLKGGPKSLDKGQRKIYEEYQKQGLERVGHMSGDLDRSIESDIMSLWDLIKKRKVWTASVKVGSTTGEWVEGGAKLAHFIGKRDQGYSAFDAGREVKKHLFDYEDLTAFEKNWLKRAIPFYTFTRKNIPLQLEKLIKNPARQTSVIKVKNNIEVMTGEDNASALVPQWLKDSAAVFIGIKNGIRRYIKLEGFIPSADLNRLSVNDVAKEMLNMLHPILKAGVEQAANRNFFFDQKITNQKGFKGFTGYGEKDLLFSKVPGRIEHLARLWRPISEVEKLIGNRYSDRTASQKIANLLVGGKIYEYDDKQLRRFFKYSTEDEYRNMSRKINEFKRELKKHPERDHLKENIKTLVLLRRKAKRKALELQRAAARSLRKDKR